MAASGRTRNSKQDGKLKDQGPNSSAFFNRTSPSPDLMSKVASLLKERTSEVPKEAQKQAAADRRRSTPTLPSTRSTPENIFMGIALQRSASSSAKSSHFKRSNSITQEDSILPGLSRRRSALTPEPPQGVSEQHQHTSSTYSAPKGAASEGRKTTDDTDSSIPDASPAWSEELLNWMLAEKAELLLEVQRAQRRQHELQQELDRTRAQSGSVADQELQRLKVERRLLLEKLHHLSQQDAETAALLERIQMDNDALTTELERSQEVCKEMLAARRAARDALSEMSAQNARLVSAYVEKKQEAAQLKEELRQHKKKAEARIQGLEAELQAAHEQYLSLQEYFMQNSNACFSPNVSQNPSPSQFQSGMPEASPASMAGERMEDEGAQASFWCPFSTPNHFKHSQSRQHEQDKENSSWSGNVERVSNARKKLDTGGDFQDGSAQPSPEPTPAASRKGKGEWDKERSELLSLLERLQHQLSVHAEQQATPARSKPPASADIGPSESQQEHSASQTPPTTCQKDCSPERAAQSASSAQPFFDSPTESASPPFDLHAAESDPAMTPPARHPSSTSSGQTPRQSHFSIPRHSQSEPPSRAERCQGSASSNSSSQTSASQGRRSSGVNLSKAFEGARCAGSSSRLSAASDESEVGTYDGFPTMPEPRPTSAASIHLSPQSSASPSTFSPELPSSPQPPRFSRPQHSPVIAPMATPFSSNHRDSTSAVMDNKQPSPNAGPGSKQEDEDIEAKFEPEAEQVSIVASLEKQRLTEVEQRNADLEAEVQRLRHLQEKADERAKQEELRKKIEHHKQLGNSAFQQQRYEEAVQEYTAGLDASAPEAAGSCAVLHCNRAAALHAMGRYLDAVADCFKAEQTDPNYARLYHRRADAYCALGVYDAAAEDLSKLAQLGCGREVQARLLEVQHKLNAQYPVNHYAVLGIKSGATAAEIKSAYRSLALKYHPDKAKHQIPDEASDAIFKLVTAANAALSDSEKRRAHDLLVLRHKYRRFYSYHF